MKYAVIILVVLIVLFFLSQKAQPAKLDAEKPCMKTVVAPGGRPFQIPCNMVYTPYIDATPIVGRAPTSDIIVSQAAQTKVLTDAGTIELIQSKYSSL